MLTILWIIRSCQPMIQMSPKTIWKYDWFTAALFTIGFVIVDVIGTALVVGFINAIVN